MAPLDGVPLDIVIHYNVERGFEEPALALARRLFAQFDEALDSLSLIPIAGDDEDFAMQLNGRLVRSRRQSGRSPRVADIRAVLEGREAVGGPGD